MKVNVPYEFGGREHKFSNFHPSPVMYEGQSFLNGEAAFQAAKVLGAVNRERFTTMDPSTSKKEGRKVNLRGDWEQVKFEVMVNVLRSKFQIPEFREALLATGYREIIENTTGWCDQIWGNCNCPKHRNISGQNLLGKALMQVRAEIQADM